MKKLSIWALAVFALTMPLFLSSCSDDDDDPIITNTIVDIAASDARFTTLVEALTKAGLVTTLQQAGPYTVFAPTNAAFDDLFNALGVSGIQDLDAATLTPILLYHVVGANVLSTDLSTGFVNSLSDGAESTKVSIDVDISSGVKLNGSANVTQADIAADNGTIHVIDAVLLPPDVVDLAINNSDFNILVEAVVHAGLESTLRMAGPYTIFAPTDAAFTSFLNGAGVASITDIPSADVAAVLLNHVVSGNIEASEVMTGMVPSLGTNALDITVSGGVTINTNVNVVVTDVQGTNGVIHVIDQVIQ